MRFPFPVKRDHFQVNIAVSRSVSGLNDAGDELRTEGKNSHIVFPLPGDLSTEIVGN